VLEDELQQQHEAHIAGLTQSVSQIRQVADAIKDHMVDDEALIVDIDKGFDKN